MIHVAIAGDGQLGRGVADALSARSDIAILGPVGRDHLGDALESGADLVVVATTTLLAEVADAIRTAVLHGSNVIVSAEEAAHPWTSHPRLAQEIDALAREREVTVLGAGLNPGFVFDALVLTLLGAVGPVTAIDVTRTVELSGFGPVVAGRLGLGVSAAEFAKRVADGRILGHAGFPQSMAVVAGATGRSLARVDARLRPVLGAGGRTVGIDQDYTGVDGGGEPWFHAHFIGRAGLAEHGLAASDRIRLERAGADPIECTISPGIGSQDGSRSVVANSIDRVLAAPPGWLTVAELPPAFPVVPSTP